jgi:hypothetical protein
VNWGGQPSLALWRREFSNHMYWNTLYILLCFLIV